MTPLLAANSSVFVLGTVASDSHGERRFNLHLLPPVLIGLAVPLISIGILDPAGLRHARVVIIALLLGLLVIAALLFLLSLVSTAEVRAVVFDRRSRRIGLVQSGILADVTVEVAFDQVRSIGAATRFDRDGYRYNQAEIVLRDGRRIALPEGTSSEAISRAKTLLGL